MKKGILILIVLVLSFAILQVGDKLAVNTSATESKQTLTGVAKGFGGDVTVKVTIDGEKIVKVEAEGPNETDGIGSKAIEELPAKIEAANSTEVEVISGATVTSNAIIEAVNNAINSAN